VLDHIDNKQEVESIFALEKIFAAEAQAGPFTAFRDIDGLRGYIEPMQFSLFRQPFCQSRDDAASAASNLSYGIDLNPVALKQVKDLASLPRRVLLMPGWIFCQIFPVCVDVSCHEMIRVLV
jgi:hypothetical protein